MPPKLMAVENEHNAMVRCMYFTKILGGVATCKQGRMRSVIFLMDVVFDHDIFLVNELRFQMYIEC